MAGILASHWWLLRRALAARDCSLVSIQSWFSTRYVAVEDLLSAPRDIVSLRTRNAELEAEVSQLQAQVIELQQRVNETDILAALVDFSRANPKALIVQLRLSAAIRALSCHYVIINRGSNDGIRAACRS